MTAGVEVERISQHYGSTKALDDVSLNIGEGEFVVLLGPSGCGKTTLLNLIGGFAEPTAGHIRIGGRDMTGVGPKDRPTTTVFQDYALFPHMTLGDNVGFGLRMRGVSRSDRRAKAEEMLSLVGLSGKSDLRPHELSGGQRQRVALARALAVSPDVLLLDEPLGALDLKLRRQMQDELKAIQRRVGTTFVHVTHDQEEAMAIADRIVVMNAGRIEDDGPPSRIYLRPRTLFTAGFMGEINRIPVLDGQCPLGSIVAGSGTLCIRPEAIGLDGGTPIGDFKLQEAAFYGTHVRAHFLSESSPDVSLLVNLPQGSSAEPGQVVELFAKDMVLL
ncbi:ABC transporter ATP-binding protein [Thioclava sp. FR2]|uniref:ABC transporter ATP-binding protein n=1 Tax=Thioclava sp. FR2 TaxID=3445780 RepID=UPI003EBC9977